MGEFLIGQDLIGEASSIYYNPAFEILEMDSIPCTNLFAVLNFCTQISLTSELKEVTTTTSTQLIELESPIP